MNGLDIDLGQFNKMSSKGRDELIYKNLRYVITNHRNSKFNTRFQYIWLFVLTIAFGFKKYLPI